MGPATYPNDLKFLSPGPSGARWYLQIVGLAQAHVQSGPWAHGPARPVTNTEGQVKKGQILKFWKSYMFMMRNEPRNPMVPLVFL